jgi:outer membrane lipoprotein-sorting protein
MKNILLVFIMILILSEFAQAKFLPVSFEAEVEQKKISKLTKIERKSKGKIIYQYPSQVHFEINDPDKIIFVCNKEKSWFYQPPFHKKEDGEVKISKNDKMGISTFFDSLNNGLVNNKYYSVNLTNNEAELVFTEESLKKLTVKKAVLHFKTDAKKAKSLNEVEWIKLQYSEKEDVVLNIKNLTQDKIYPTQQFTFKIPDNTRVIE